METLTPGKDYIGIGIGVLILNEDRTKTLLLLRGPNAKNEPGTWSRPGGTVEYGETLMQAVRREIKEELGIDLVNLEQRELLDHLIPAEHQHWIAVGFWAQIVPGQEPKNLEPTKHPQLRWFGKEEIPSNLYSASKAAVDAWIAA
jgi:8-oxo-dGTP pyrophosphatase MutT (NUDIX family)